MGTHVDYVETHLDATQRNLREALAGIELHECLSILIGPEFGTHEILPALASKRLIKPHLNPPI